MSRHSLSHSTMDAPLVGTCGWIEWLIDGPLADRFVPHLRHPPDLVVPTIVQFEEMRGLSRLLPEALFV